MQTTIRGANRADAPRIAEVNLASWEAAYRGLVADAFLDGVSLAGRTASWQEAIAGGSPVLVAEAGGAIIGYCGLALPARDEDIRERVAEIVALYVSPRMFRSGAGSALMARALELVAARGFGEVVLWVLSTNARARAFYTRHGFSPDGAVKWIEELAAEESWLRRPV